MNRRIVKVEEVRTPSSTTKNEKKVVVKSEEYISFKELLGEK